MTRSFGIVEEKVYESDFFLEKVAESEDLREANYYFSAFISAARSITFALQASLSGLEGFEEWYMEKQQLLRENELARFFTDARNYSQKQGRTYIHSGSRKYSNDGGEIFPRRYYFETPVSNQHNANLFIRIMVSDESAEKQLNDAYSQCKNYMVLLAEIIYDCFQRFGPVIDPEQYYTLENINNLGLTIEDIEEKVGFPRAYTDANIPDEERMRLIRNSQPRTEIDYIFVKYFNKDKFGRIQT